MIDGHELLWKIIVSAPGTTAARLLKISHVLRRQITQHNSFRLKLMCKQIDLLRDRLKLCIELKQDIF